MKLGSRSWNSVIGYGLWYPMLEFVNDVRLIDKFVSETELGNIYTGHFSRTIPPPRTFPPYVRATVWKLALTHTPDPSRPTTQGSDPDRSTSVNSVHINGRSLFTVDWQMVVVQGGKCPTPCKKGGGIVQVEVFGICPRFVSCCWWCSPMCTGETSSSSLQTYLSGRGCVDRQPVLARPGLRLGQWTDGTM